MNAGPPSARRSGPAPAPPAAATITVVDATGAHLDAVRQLTGLSASTRAALDRDLAAPDHHHLVALDPSGEVVGFATGVLLADAGHVVDVAVAAHARRRGVGRTLVTALTARLRQHGAVGATLEVRPSNTAAIALYRHLGFVVEGIRPRYYPDGEDALLMWSRETR